VNEGNANFGLEVWCGFVKRRERVFVEPSVTTNTWGSREGPKFIRCGLCCSLLCQVSVV